jgi:hypothetical protein
MPIAEFCVSCFGTVMRSCQAIQISDHRIGEIPVVRSHLFKSNIPQVSIPHTSQMQRHPLFFALVFSGLVGSVLNPGPPPSQSQGIQTLSSTPALYARDYFLRRNCGGTQSDFCESCCGQVCCNSPAGAPCCTDQNGNNFCCPEGSICCGNGCCGGGTTCCDNTCCG